MSTDEEYTRDSTKEIDIPTPEALCERAALRVARCIQACDGIDAETLEILAYRPDGVGTATTLQQILTRISWTSLQRR